MQTDRAEPAKPAGNRALRRWSALHRWSSLPPTLVLLMLCVTGLPLIFDAELSALLGQDASQTTTQTTTQASTPAAGHGAQAARHDRPAALDAMARAAQRREPGRVVQFIIWDADNRDAVLFSLARSVTDFPAHNANVAVSRATGRIVPPDAGAGFTETVKRLHTQLFLGQAGGLVLGLVALSFVVSLVSGIVLYAPFMGQRGFGTIRKRAAGQTRRRDLDWHNFLGITLAAWLLVVGGTGWINSWGSLIFEHWRAQIMAPQLAQGHPLPRGAMAGAGAVLAASTAQVPDTEPYFIAMPGSPMADPGHYGVYVRGLKGWRKRQVHLVIVDAFTGKVSAVPQVPWYINALMVSQPLHFGDYGGLALKLLWAVLDLLAIHVLWTGLRLWWHKRGQA